MSNADIGLLCSLMINDRFLPEPRNMATISRVKDDESVKRDTSGQIVKGEQRSATEKHSGEIVASDDQKVSDDEEYCWGMAASFPLVTSKDALHPRNLRFLRRRRISSAQRTSVVNHAEDPGKRLTLMIRLVVLSVCRKKQSAEAHKQRKVEPPILPSPRMAEDAAEVRNL